MAHCDQEPLLLLVNGNAGQKSGVIMSEIGREVVAETRCTVECYLWQPQSYVMLGLNICVTYEG